MTLKKTITKFPAFKDLNPILYNWKIKIKRDCFKEQIRIIRLKSKEESIIIKNILHLIKNYLISNELVIP
jgi:hypothetical protein